jgi:hypothetical protein
MADIALAPTGVEGQVRDDLRNLSGLDAVFEREVEVIWHFDCLIAGDECRQCHDAAVAKREPGTFPYLAKQAVLSIGRQRRSDLPYIFIGEDGL